MYRIIIAFLMFSNVAFAQSTERVSDSVISYFTNGKIDQIRFTNDLYTKRIAHSLPIQINYYKNGLLKMEKYILKDIQYRVWYSDSEKNEPFFASDEKHTQFEYENGQISTKISRNSRTRMVQNCPEQVFIPYSYETGTFRNFILNNGTIQYFSKNDSLITSVEVVGGRGINDPAVSVNDKILLQQIFQYAGSLDLNHNGKFEESEALLITKVNIDETVKSFSGLEAFKNLHSVFYKKHYFKRSDHASLEAFVAFLDTKRDIPNQPPTLEMPPFLPIFVPCPFNNVDLLPRSKLYEFPDVEAQFPGGFKAMREWLDSNLVYPEFHRMTDEYADERVFVSFEVEQDGSISNVKTIRGADKYFNQEAKRAVLLMPKWIPGEVKGVPVRSRISIPIRFTRM